MGALLYGEALVDDFGTEQVVGGAPFNVALGIDPQTGIDRGSVRFASAAYVLPAFSDGPQWLARMDHYQSEKHRLSWRYSSSSTAPSPARSTWRNRRARAHIRTAPVMSRGPV